MKLYPKTYENVFTSKGSLYRCNIDKVKIFDFESISEFVIFARKEIRNIMESYWTSIIKATWLFFKFSYNNKRRQKLCKNGVSLDAAFTVFFKQYVGIDVKVFNKTVPFFSIIQSYFKDFYSDFDNHNPFTEPEYYKFPYKNISIDHMSVVYQMPERLDILQYAEEHSMNFGEFLDWVINYMYSYNEEVGKEIFILHVSSRDFTHIQVKKNKINKFIRYQKQKHGRK